MVKYPWIFHETAMLYLIKFGETLSLEIYNFLIKNRYIDFSTMNNNYELGKKIVGYYKGKYIFKSFV